VGRAPAAAASGPTQPPPAPLFAAGSTADAFKALSLAAHNAPGGGGPLGGVVSPLHAAPGPAPASSSARMGVGVDAAAAAAAAAAGGGASPQPFSRVRRVLAALCVHVLRAPSGHAGLEPEPAPAASSPSSTSASSASSAAASASSAAALVAALAQPQPHAQLAGGSQSARLLIVAAGALAAALAAVDQEAGGGGGGGSGGEGRAGADAAGGGEGRAAQGSRRDAIAVAVTRRPAALPGLASARAALFARTQLALARYCDSAFVSLAAARASPAAQQARRVRADKEAQIRPLQPMIDRHRALCAALKYDEAERLAQGADVAALRRYVDEVRAGVAEEARAEAAAREAEEGHRRAAVAAYCAFLRLQGGAGNGARAGAADAGADEDAEGDAAGLSGGGGGGGGGGAAARAEADELETVFRIVSIWTATELEATAAASAAGPAAAPAQSAASPHAAVPAPQSSVLSPTASAAAAAGAAADAEAAAAAARDRARDLASRASLLALFGRDFASGVPPASLLLALPQVRGGGDLSL
jgi:hypothetical protein